jgi:tight adherence protein B
MSSALRAGFSLQMAFEAVTEDAPSVIVETFREVLAEMEVGQSFEEALKKMLERVDTAELRLFVSSVIIQRESGGNLAELLDNLEATIRERFELQRELISATAQARFSGLILSLLPIFVGGIVYLINKPYMMTLFEDPAGKQLLTIAVCMQLLGFFVIYKIVNIKI